MKRRRLSDLYVVGKAVTFDDGNGPVEIWLQKLNPVEHQDALRRANAERARARAMAEDKNSDTYLASLAEINDFASDESLKTLALADEFAAKRLIVEAQVADEDQWKKEDYLQGLFDLWLGRKDEGESMSDTYALNPEDPEAKRVFEELQRFESQVDDLYKKETAALLRDYEGQDRSVLVERAVDKYLDRVIRGRFADEYVNFQLYLGVREPADHGAKYFRDLDEVRRLDAQIRGRLIEELEALSVDPIEGKDLPGTPGSSTPSESSEKEETSQDSGLVAAAA